MGTFDIICVNLKLRHGVDFSIRRQQKIVVVLYRIGLLCIGLHENMATKNGSCMAIQNALVAFMAGGSWSVVEHLGVVVYVLATMGNV